MMLRPRSGFTLIELLVVMGIIAVLMGLLIPGITLVRRQAKIAKAKEQLSQIQAACSLYRDANGVYPALDPTTSTWMGTNGEANAEPLRRSLVLVAPDLFRDGKSVIDPWGSKIRYRPARVYEFNPDPPSPAPPSEPLIAGPNPPNLESYQLWSIGPDTTDQIADGNQGDGDDLPNWKKR